MCSVQPGKTLSSTIYLTQPCSIRVVCWTLTENCHTCSSECVKISLKHTHVQHGCGWKFSWSSLRRLHIHCLKAVLVNHFAVLLAFFFFFTLWEFRGKYISDFIITALKWILWNMGGFGRMLKDSIYSRIFKGKNAVKSCWCTGIVKKFVSVYSCVLQSHSAKGETF